MSQHPLVVFVVGVPWLNTLYHPGPAEIAYVGYMQRARVTAVKRLDRRPLSFDGNGNHPTGILRFCRVKGQQRTGKRPNKRLTIDDQRYCNGELLPPPGTPLSPSIGSTTHTRSRGLEHPKSSQRATSLMET